MPPTAKHERYRYDEYLTWSDDERWELIDGKAYNMTPAPSFRHQRIAGNFYRIISNALQGRRCVPGIAPTDVVLSDYDVVQPDVFVVCDENKITEQIIRGAPDLVLEVASPATARKDRMEKKRLYEAAGVREYILIDPEGQYAERFLLDEEGRFDRGEVFGPQQVMPLKSIESVDVPLWEVFEVTKED
jgi:Uma2 family endonuclease